MSRLTTSIDIDATPGEVWRVIEDIDRHVDWMEDAVAIHFTSGRTTGVGTEFDCDTHVGPFSLVDHMEITRWQPGREMGVRHVGVVAGDGVMTMRAVGRGRRRRTRFTWTERLTFPWWMGGPVGAFAARPILGRVWRRNLRNLKGIVEAT